LVTSPEGEPMKKKFRAVQILVWVASLFVVAGCDSDARKHIITSYTTNDFESTGSFESTSEKLAQPRENTSCDLTSSAPYDARLRLGQKFQNKFSALNSDGNKSVFIENSQVTQLQDKKSFQLAYQDAKNLSLSRTCDFIFADGVAPASNCTAASAPLLAKEVTCTFTVNAKIPAVRTTESGFFTLANSLQKVSSQKIEETLGGQIFCPGVFVNVAGFQTITTIKTGDLVNPEAILDCESKISVFTKTTYSETLGGTLFAAKSKELLRAD
jgi:hypothetical protein